MSATVISDLYGPGIQGLAKYARYLNTSKNISQISSGFYDIVTELWLHVPSNLLTHRQRDSWIRSHPICQLLAFRLRSLCYTEQMRGVDIAVENLIAEEIHA